MNSGEDSNSDSMNGKWMSNSEIASKVISKYTAPATNSKRKIAPIVKDDDEYMKKRQRNNVAVKKSREKAKTRIHETQGRVEQLSKENEELQTKVTLLSKELNVLRALFTNGGFTLPGELQLMNGNSSVSDHGPQYSNNISPLSSGDESTPIRHHHHHHLPLVEHEKSAFHSPDETKIPPLRPMPRVPPPRDVPPHHHKSHHSSTHSPRSYTVERDISYKYKPERKSPSGAAPPLLIQPGPSSIATYLNSSQFKPETQHTSVIRSASELTGSSSSYSVSNTQGVSNTLGKFCIIQDPESNGGIKIVPISA